MRKERQRNHILRTQLNSDAFSPLESIKGFVACCLVCSKRNWNQWDMADCTWDYQNADITNRYLNQKQIDKTRNKSWELTKSIKRNECSISWRRVKHTDGQKYAVANLIIVKFIEIISVYCSNPCRWYSKRSPKFINNMRADLLTIESASTVDTYTVLLWDIIIAHQILTFLRDNDNNRIANAKR